MTREEVNQTLNELCEYGGMMLDWRYVEAIKIAAIFYETGEDTATKKEKSCKDCKHQKFREAYSCVETPCDACYEASHFEPKQTATEEDKSCLKCRYYPNTAPCDSCDGYSNYNEWQTTTKGVSNADSD